MGLRSRTFGAQELRYDAVDNLQSVSFLQVAFVLKRNVNITWNIPVVACMITETIVLFYELGTPTRSRCKNRQQIRFQINQYWLMEDNS